MNAIRTIGAIVAVVALSGVVACAPAMPPSELVTARTAYERASSGPTATLDPADLHAAKESLGVAEASFAKDGDTQETKDLSYASERTTETAEARARTMDEMGKKEAVLAKMHAAQTTEVRLTSAQLGQANKDLATQGQQLANETERRLDAERRAAQLSADLAKFATVKRDARGMVITLSGSVLFASAKSELLSDAQVKLNDVANALSKQDPESKIVVEGYTDSQGTASFNQDLSQRRAESVRTYLVSRGISSDRISSEGFGPTRPLADNASPEGRANNRRVEIVVQPTSK